MKHYADVVELVDTRALGARALGREGSSPFIRTRGDIINKPSVRAVFCYQNTFFLPQRGVAPNRGKKKTVGGDLRI